MNFLTNDKKIGDWLGKNGIGTEEFIGTVSVITVIFLISEFFRFRNSTEIGKDDAANNLSPNIKPLITSLLPRNLHNMFKYTDFTACTQDDIARLLLIAEVIKKKAETEIHVIGRGTQLEESKREQYVNAVANAILGGIKYKRILIIDPAFPENALLWLLLLERFLNSAVKRGKINARKFVETVKNLL